MYRVVKNYAAKVVRGVPGATRANAVDIWGKTEKQKIHARTQMEKHIGPNRQSIFREAKPKKLTPNASLAAAVNALSVAESRLEGLSRDEIQPEELVRQVLKTLVQDLDETMRMSKGGEKELRWLAFTEYHISLLIDRKDMSLNCKAINGGAHTAVAECLKDLQQMWDASGPEVDLHSATQAAMLQVVVSGSKKSIEKIHEDFSGRIDGFLEKFPKNMERIWRRTYGGIFENHHDEFDKIMRMPADSIAQKNAYLKQMSALDHDLAAIDPESLHKMKIAWDGRR